MVRGRRREVQGGSETWRMWRNLGEVGSRRRVGGAQEGGHCAVKVVTGIRVWFCAQWARKLLVYFEQRSDNIGHPFRRTTVTWRLKGGSEKTIWRQLQWPRPEMMVAWPRWQWWNDEWFNTSYSLQGERLTDFADDLYVGWRRKKGVRFDFTLIAEHLEVWSRHYSNGGSSDGVGLREGAVWK